MRSGVIVVVLLVSALPLQGQDIRGLAWTSPFSLSTGAENKFPVGDRNINDNVATFDSPALSHIWRTPRNSLITSYEGEYEMFATYSQYNMWTQAAGLRNSYELSRRATFEFGDGLLLTKDPARWLTGATFLLPRSDVKDNDAYLSLSYQLSPATALDTRFDATYVSAKQSAGIGLILFENRTYSQSASLSRILMKRSRVSATYGYVRVDPLGPPPTPGISVIRNMQTMTVSYTYFQPEKFLVSIGGGALRTTTTSYTVEAHVERRAGLMRLRADYGRQFAAYSIFGTAANPSSLIPAVGGGLLPSAVVDTGTIDIGGRLGGHLGFDLRGMYANTSSTLTVQNIRSWLALGRIDYLLTDRISAFIGVDLFRQNLTFPLGSPIDRNRYMAGIEFALARQQIISAETSALPITNRLTNSLLIDDPLRTGPAARRKD